ncbi:Peptidase C14 caspase domain-containing protein [Nostoc sp. DSM 114161]|jgi:WD40 repeat protein/energy-coupling factor transporter ATP-binding protein EcfA2|uniref:nSTAND1 domain-containing NTPase n=1 Tax=Nostoc sp. DSM 114161 TaxID=3440143 RepID=UPI00404585F8
MARYALVLGIAKYDNFSNLPKAVNDAEQIAQLLREQGRFDVQPLPSKLIESENRWQVTLDKKLTGKELGQALRIFLLEKAKGNEALIYFAGYGFEAPSLTGEAKGYLATSDCNKDGQNAIAFDDLNTLIAKSQLSSLVVLLDCCYAGSLLERSFIKSGFSVFNSKQDYSLITASRAFERAREDAEGGIFTKAILKGLAEDKADEATGEINVNDLMSFISRELKGSGQEPIYMGGGRSIPLVWYPPKKLIVITEVLDECPYRGLEAFDKQHAKFFFGRQKVVNHIQQKLDLAKFVPIIGASGSGKSSVVRAGLIPQLDDREWQVLEPIKPGFEPLIKLRGAFQQFFPGVKKEKQLKDLIENEQNSLSTILENLSDSAKLLLVVDQFEEVFTGGASQQEKQRFIDLLTQVVEITDLRLAVVITMRADFLEPCLQYPSLTQLIQTQAVYMPPLTGIDLKDTITEPAKLQGHSVEEGLVLKILEDVKQEPGFLPLLEFALTKLWEKRDQEKYQLTLEEYQKLGGLTGALNLHAENVYLYQDYEEEFPTQERTQQEKEWIERIFLRLVRTGEGENDTRQRQPKVGLLAIAGNDQEQEQALSELLDEGLVKGRLLVAGKDEQGKAWIDLAHEALIESWERFGEWRQQDRDLRRLSERLADALREWENKCENEKYLMHGGLLAEVRENWHKLEISVSSLTKKFYQRSDSYEKDQIAELQRALTEANLATLREKAARAQNLLSVQPLDGLVLTILTVGENLEKMPQQIIEQVQKSLNWAITKGIVSIPFRGHDGIVMSVAFSPDGQTIVSAGFDGTVRLWNIQGYPVADPFRGHQGFVRSVTFSPDGQKIVSGGEDGTVRLWHIQGKPLADPFCGHEGIVISVAFSRDGQTIASGGLDGTVRLWNIKNNPMVDLFSGHKHCASSVVIGVDVKQIFPGGYVSSVDFSMDGHKIVNGSVEGRVWLWDIQGQSLADPLRGHEGYIPSVAISLDGQRIASGGADETVRLWAIQGHPLADPLRGHQGYVCSVAISPDGQTIASGGVDGTVRLWDIQGHWSDIPTHSLVDPLRGHEGDVCCVTFSPDGQMIVSGGKDGTLRLWNIQGHPLADSYRSRKIDVMSVAMRSDGQTIVSSGSEGEVQASLQLCCDRLRYHPIFTNPETEEAKAACEVCRKYVWSKEAVKSGD